MSRSKARSEPISIFIAYSREDFSAMRRVKDWLQSAGFDVWSDEDLKIGTVDWQRSIQRKIEAADYLLILLSPDSAESYWVQAELAYAAIHEVSVFSVLARGRVEESLPPSLLEMDIIDIRENFEGAMARLIAMLLRGRSTPTQGQPAFETAAPPRSKWKHEVFLSYSHKDIALMQKVLATLRDAGFRIWFDENMPIGTPSWLASIEQAIENAGCLVGILTPNAKASEWVQEELNYARMQELQRFLLLGSGDHITSIPFGCAQVQYADIREDYPGGMLKTITDIKSYLHLT